MQTAFPPEDFDKTVALTIKHQMLPAWEHYGLERLVIAATTLPGFQAQSLPESIKVWERIRERSRSIKNKGSAMKNYRLESWPQDDQESLRWPGFFFVCSGQAELRVGNCVVAVPAGYFLLVPPGVPKPAGRLPHLESPRQGKECEVWSFHSTGNYDYVGLSACYCMGDRKIDSGHYYMVNDTHAVQLFHTFAQELVSQQPYHAKVGYGALQMFLLLFLREIEAGRYYDHGRGRLAKPGTPLHSPVDMARRYIERNLSSALTIETVSQAVFMAPTSFSRQFHAETGKTFREYLIDKRLEEARRWLSRDSCSINMVCASIGMKNSRFHQLFQQRFGMTPKQYRQRNKKLKIACL